MTEGEVTQQLVMLMEVTLTGIAVTFSIVSAYVVALYYFLHDAPFVLKAAAFFFFTLVLGLIVVFSMGAFDHAAALHHALEALGAQASMSPIGRAALARGSSVDTHLRTVILAAFGVIYLSLVYLTFIHRWKIGR